MLFWKICRIGNKAEREYEVRAAEGGYMEIIRLNGTIAERHSD